MAFMVLRPVRAKCQHVADLKVLARDLMILLDVIVGVDHTAFDAVSHDRTSHAFEDRLHGVRPAIASDEGCVLLDLGEALLDLPLRHDVVHVRMEPLLLEELDQLGCMDKACILSRPDAEVPVFSNSHVDMDLINPG